MKNRGDPVNMFINNNSVDMKQKQNQFKTMEWRPLRTGT